MGLLGGLAAGFLGAGLFGMLFGGGLFSGLGGFSSILGDARNSSRDLADFVRGWVADDQGIRSCDGFAWCHKIVLLGMRRPCGGECERDQQYQAATDRLW